MSVVTSLMRRVSQPLFLSHNFLPSISAAARVSANREEEQEDAAAHAGAWPEDRDTGTVHHNRAWHGCDSFVLKSMLENKLKVWGCFWFILILLKFFFFFFFFF